MTTYPPRYGTGPTAVEHWATACVASARVLRAQGHPDQAADLQDAADHAHTTEPLPTEDTAPASVEDPGSDSADRDPTTGDTRADQGDEGEVPSWWR